MQVAPEFIGVKMTSLEECSLDIEISEVIHWVVGGRLGILTSTSFGTKPGYFCPQVCLGLGPEPMSVALFSVGGLAKKLKSTKTLMAHSDWIAECSVHFLHTKTQKQAATAQLM